MANMTPEEFMETYNPPVGKYDEVNDAYLAYIQSVAKRCVENGEELDTDLLKGELSFDTFMIKIWEKGQKDESN